MVANILKKIMSRVLAPILSKQIDEYGAIMQMSPKERVYIANLLNDNRTFLEIGSGNSTLWFSQFADRIVSVESRKEWFGTIQKLLSQYNVTNVELHLFQPEPCAYDENGQERWNNRNTVYGSDYGTKEEFFGYLHGIEHLLSNTDFDIVLVDGNVRCLVIRLLRDRNYKGIILLHDVIPERDYLNRTILTMEGLKTVRQVDSLVELIICP